MVNSEWLVGFEVSKASMPECTIYHYPFTMHCSSKQKCWLSPAAASGGMNRPAVHLALNCARVRDIIMARVIMSSSLNEAGGFVNGRSSSAIPKGLADPVSLPSATRVGDPRKLAHGNYLGRW
jgi:hypothetical protein